jgi:6-phosphogluconolactonase
MLKSAQTVIDIQPDAVSVAGKVAHWLLELALKAKDRFTVSLSGGSTPKLLYQTLAEKKIADQMPWEIIHWFWGDERFVSKKDPMSNFHMVEDAMLSKVPIPAANIHAINTEVKEPDRAAALYEKELKSFYGSDKLDPEKPLFDVTLLGLGPDGHTASLFPGTHVLNERVAWASAVVGAKPEPRITLTYPTLESSRAVAFLVTGREKREIAKQVITGAAELPAARIRPTGTLFWFFDEAAYPRI